MRKPVVLGIVAAAVVAAAGCGSSSKTASGGSTKAASTPSAAQAVGAHVALRKVSFGEVLVGANGHTVYLFEKDKGTASMCTGGCAGEWSPLTTGGQPQAGPGLNASLLGASRRADGTMQVTYGKHPLYYYADDKRPGQTEGQGKKEFGAEWYALGADGKKVEQAGS